jgi:TolA-binding protein
MTASPVVTVLLGLLIGLVGLGWPAWGASPPPEIELPLPELGIQLVPPAFGITRTPVEPPAPPPVLLPPQEGTEAPLPRFQTTVPKPSPPVPEVGALACTLAALGRASSLFECGVERLLANDLRGAREPLEGARDHGDDAIAGAARVWLGELAFRQGRYDLAQRDYLAALEGRLTPDLRPHAALGYGWASLLRGDLAAADRGFGQVLAASPGGPLGVFARFLQGVAWLGSGRVQEAHGAWEIVARSGPSVAVAEELLFWRGVAETRLAGVGEAQATFDQFLRTVGAGHPLRPDALVRIGWVLLARAVPDQAVRRFLEVDTARRGDLKPEVSAGLVRAYLAMDDLPRARDEAKRLAAMGPKPWLQETLVLVADDAARRGQDAEAEALYGEIRKHTMPPVLDDYVTYRLGAILERRGRSAEAERLYAKLRDGGRAEALAQRAAYRLGLLFLRSERPGLAMREAEALIRGSALPELREAVLFMGAEAALRGRDPNRAAAMFRVLLRDHPGGATVPSARLGLGWALYQDGAPGSALREWGAAALASDLAVAAQAYLLVAEVSLARSASSPPGTPWRAGSH